MTRKPKYAYQLGTLELRDDRLFLRKTLRGDIVEIDVTPLWHFFKDVQKFLHEPL